MGLRSGVEWRCRGPVHKAASKGLSSSVETSEEALLVSDAHLAHLSMDRGILPLLEMVELVINCFLCVRKWLGIVSSLLFGFRCTHT
jgi:hypothetical protein